ncbi:MAG: PQQ-dependent sugar dehydrogenase [Bacteroidota bacterium]
MRISSRVLVPLFVVGAILVYSFRTASFFPPPGAISPFLNGVFPRTTPGAGGAWELVDPLPGQTFYGPVRIIPFTSSTDVLVLGKWGEIWRIDLEDQLAETVLDIKDRSFKLGDGGTVGMVLHPKFGDPSEPDKQVVFVYYRHKPDPDQWDEIGYNRLSKFRWDPVTETFDADSEEILIQQYDRMTWHNGGALFFGPDEMLYISVGDEGNESQRVISTQRLDGGLFSGILRIDVDNDPSRSHPIVRQPIAYANPPNDWPETFTQGYMIPNDNPWLSPDGEHLEEFYAIGLRSPYAMSYDYETGRIWVADVGGATQEEISQARKGDNMQWPYFEGTHRLEAYDRPAEEDYIGVERAPYLAYERTFGACIIGGDVYQGTKFPELVGKYLFADYISNRLMALSTSSEQVEPEIETLLPNLDGQPVDIPQGAGITGVFPMPNGDILITIIGNRMEVIPGKIFRLKRSVEVADPPAKLSELGVFTDLESLTPVAGIIPYDVQSPLWSDRATKKRWIALPNDGTFDNASEQIQFRSKQDWDFPVGTVFIKHFDLPLTLGENGPSQRLETRFFVIGEDNRSYGLTYKWNEEGTEAFLQGGGSAKTFSIADENGQFAYEQAWDYPSREQCMTCHNTSANHVLGVKTHQLNGELDYPHLGEPMNQLTYLNELGVFNQDIGSASRYDKAYPIDDETIDLDLRIRSYFDANCASCHRHGALPTVHMDLQFHTPLILKNIIGVPTTSNASDPDRLIIQAGDHSVSEFWLRDASITQERMPPLARNLVDEVYVDELAEWIDGLSPIDVNEEDNIIFPNPTDDWLGIRFGDSWEGPFEMRLIALDGRLIHQSTIESVTETLDLSILPSGVYLLELSSFNGRREIERILVY